MTTKPLAEQLRPTTIDEVVGQEHLIGPGKPLRFALENKLVRSMIFWGPPGTGKTTIARLFANNLHATFVEFSAVTSGVADVRRTIAEAKTHSETNKESTILFVDEIHRFNKAQQDSFLPHVEAGTIVLIGATTENPGFEVIGPLISRSQVFQFMPLADNAIAILIDRALKTQEGVSINKDAQSFLVRMSNGDARTAINAVQVAIEMVKPKGKITLETSEMAIQRKAALYDKKGDNHYDAISAFIKSMRGSDPDAALHYLARMLEGGEDPMFIARRMVIFASEDIGNILPTALVVATTAMQATHMVGLPEAQLILAQAATYLATAPKSRAVYRGIVAARHDVRHERLEPIPLHLRNPVNKVMEEIGAGKGYDWPEKDGGTITDLGYLPANFKGRKYYRINNIKNK